VIIHCLVKAFEYYFARPSSTWWHFFKPFAQMLWAHVMRSEYPINLHTYIHTHIHTYIHTYSWNVNRNVLGIWYCKYLPSWTTKTLYVNVIVDFFSVLEQVYYISQSVSSESGSGWVFCLTLVLDTPGHTSKCGFYARAVYHQQVVEF